MHFLQRRKNCTDKKVKYYGYIILVTDGAYCNLLYHSDRSLSVYGVGYKQLSTLLLSVLRHVDVF